MSLTLLGSGPDSPICSRAGCRADAEWNVNWRNPKIHGEERVKIWLACGEHREYLSEYLAARDFPVLVTPLNEPITRLPPLEGLPQIEGRAE